MFCFLSDFSLLPQLSIAKMDPLSQVFCLKWNNHQNNLLTVLDHLYQTEAFCDVTLACDNTSIKCHKMILSACSSYFQTLFMENTCEHPIVFLKDIKIGEVRAILDYMYKGEVNVAQEELPGKSKVRVKKTRHVQKLAINKKSTFFVLCPNKLSENNHLIIFHSV